ncbi:glutamate--tRNA(Gln) ligase /glutamyl-tRNA synthetase [Zymomonas mobilis]|uniref:glutamate--tRNA ligase n=1 Tax=Zymomonas mobilis TaxID=542 RepID=UPI00026D8A5A|nr:glutamate--tRNA ligase [Zymomonas mobilis]AFN56301.1 glutamyl-tRNA synthetase [Zymomonas mobilis subsp. mobilis ATCC 29191]TQK78269.1 glutamate--tRNA(Gln) ligase /glutamyl-tRNA synthetase [Zymomonas mobilis]TQL15084.1 glutamate--tRNA(Gln) ligase /glutamyl-tRNA synthetase [Zymomonas mobilis]GEB87590.1 glutamate--tRNA ligase [Zymomonas mobilis subsp. mobilis]
MITTRFAPSPTGFLHVGNIRTALINWLYARHHHGRFVLRIDDTDSERSTEEYTQAIRADLAWLNLNPDVEYSQSKRSELYEIRFESLKAKGRIYPCYETPQELDLKRRIAIGRGLPPIYDRAALNLTIEARSELEEKGIKPHWRFRLDHDHAIKWNDLIRGEQRFDPKLLSDPVIRRADGSWLYLLPSVIDDIDMEITTIVRGEDHVSNTATQIQMFQALEAELPEFAHMALLTGGDAKISKRFGADSVADFKADHIEPIALEALLARIGTSDPVEVLTDLAPLVENFDFSHFSRAPARFDMAELKHLNARILHIMPYEQVADRLPEAMDAHSWEVIRPNIDDLSEAAFWWSVVKEDIAKPDLSAEDKAYLVEAMAIAKTLDWSSNPWKEWIDILKKQSGRKGKALFLPLRLALTGQSHGPDMAGLLSLIGHEKAIKRLEQAVQ